MDDFKSMYYQLKGRLEVASDVLDSTARMLKSASTSIKEITKNNEKNINRLKDSFTKTVNEITNIDSIHKITDTFSLAIDNITETDTKTLEYMCHIIETSSDSFMLIKENLLVPPILENIEHS